MGHKTAQLVCRRLRHVRVQAFTLAPAIHLCDCVAGDLRSPMPAKRVEALAIFGAEKIPEGQRRSVAVRNDQTYAADDISRRPCDEYRVNGMLIVPIAFPLALLQSGILELVFDAVHLVSQRVCGVE